MNSWTPVEWITAIRFLKEGRMQTIFIIAGVALGVAVIVFMSSLMTGLQANFVKQLLSSQPHIQILPAKDVARPLRREEGAVVAAIVQQPAQRPRSIDQWQTVLRMLRERPDVTAASPTISAAALAIRGEASRSITMTRCGMLSNTQVPFATSEHGWPKNRRCAKSPLASSISPSSDSSG